MAFMHPLLIHLMMCGNVYFELKASSPELDRGSFVCMELPTPFYKPYNVSDAEKDNDKLPVKLPRSTMTTYAIIDPEDKERLTAISKVWRVSSSGYIMTSKRRSGKYSMFYLHKEVLGQSGTHLNGNRLDNRKSNLVPVKRQRRIQDVSETFMVKSMQPLADFPIRDTDLLIPDLQHATIVYPGGKTYIGAIKNFKPDGFGKLIEKHPINKETHGVWSNGEFRTGVVTQFKRLPPYFRQDSTDLISNGILRLFVYVNGRDVTNNGNFCL